MKYAMLLLALSIPLALFGQTWNWWSDGYESGSGGGTYLNVDGEGTDMVITGLVNDFAACTFMNECIEVGIDNQESEGLQHVYHFSFSNPVSVQFDIDEINEGFLCYNDYLSFSGSPEFSNQTSVTIAGNTIIPEESHPINGFITVTYHSVTEFTITHGEGESCNPGHIHISSLNFDLTSNTGRELTVAEEIRLFPNPVGDRLHIENNYDTSIQVDVLNAQGRVVGQYAVSSTSTAYLDTSNYPQGVYFAHLRMEGRLIKTQKIIVRK
jgi:hypothetical protein